MDGGEKAHEVNIKVGAGKACEGFTSRKWRKGDKELSVCNCKLITTTIAKAHSVYNLCCLTSYVVMTMLTQKYT